MTTFVWAHGLTSSMESEDESGHFGWLAPGALPGVDVVRYDARGHGTSPGSTNDDDYRWDHLADDLLVEADAAGAEQFVAGGASMGCATALYSAVIAPERVTGLVLVIPPTAWETRAAQADLYKGGADFVVRRGVDEFIDRMRLQPPAPLFAAEPPETREAGFRSLASMDPASLPHVLRGAAESDLPEPAQLRDIKVPALILAWDRDPGHPLSTAQELHRLLPSSELHVATSVSDLPSWTGLVAEFLVRQAP
jgi:pimeloyl-ACP methyl ester carboxylesterase